MNIEQIRTAAEAQLSYLKDPSCVRIFIGSSAVDSNVAPLIHLLQNAIDREGLPAKVIRTGSSGFHDLEPTVMVKRRDMDAILYTNFTPDRVDGFIKDILSDRSDAPRISEVPLFSAQKRVALRNCGWIDPEDIHHYIEHGRGYSGLAKALQMSPADLLVDWIPLALKGRGGLDCSVLDQWRQFSGAENIEKYLICNAGDPDPGSRTSQLLLESDPHSVLEGLTIAACAAGASHCIIYVEESAEAGSRLDKALSQMRAYNLSGPNILDSRFCLDIQIREMPKSVISGHKVELCRCIEEKQPQPHMLPAIPDTSEFIEKSVLFVNPEAMSSLPAVLPADRPEDMASKVVTLSGSVAHRGTVEIPHGTTVLNIIECFGGGVSSGKTLMTVQLGGPTGLFAAPDALDLSVGCDAEEETRSSIGSGTIEVLDTDSRIVDIVKDRMTYIQTQSCGKCVFCREGCLQILTVLEDISENKRRPQDLDLLMELGEEMKTMCLCDFGRDAPNPVLSSIRLFREEYEK
jgi:NADH:ubiquinone oxidoreductase subunit F (NADH-binding)